MTLERPELFDRRSLGVFLLAMLLVASFSLLRLYGNYLELKRFDTAQLDMQVLSHQIKTNKNKTYGLLKLHQDNLTLYTRVSKHYRNLQGRSIRVMFWPERITFASYLGGTFVRSAVLKLYPDLDVKERLARYIAAQHHNHDMGALYGALFFATPMHSTLRSKLSALGVSHLLAISGFHLGLLSAFVYGILYWPYRLVQSRYFPWRHRNRDLFVLTLIVLGAYLLFLGWIPSLMRAFVMLLVGYVLYDRGIKVLSMQTLFLSVVLLLALWPMLFFSIGFWLSVAGVYYIFLFLMYVGGFSKLLQAVVLSFGVYVMMLPLALYLFGTFSLWHPLSMVWTLLFTLFYPLSMLLHVIGWGAMLDVPILWMLEHVHAFGVALPFGILALHVTLSLLALRYRVAFILALALAIIIAIGAIKQVA